MGAASPSDCPETGAVTATAPASTPTPRSAKTIRLITSSLLALDRHGALWAPRDDGGGLFGEGCASPRRGASPLLRPQIDPHAVVDELQGIGAAVVGPGVHHSGLHHLAEELLPALV